MRERLPKTSPGKQLSSEAVNRAFSGIQRTTSQRPGPFIAGINAHSIQANIAVPPWQQFTVEVYAVADDNVDGHWFVRVRYFEDSTDDGIESDSSSASSAESSSGPGGEWLTDTIDLILDATDFGSVLTIGQKVTAWWNAQRGMFIPISAGSTVTETYQLLSYLAGGVLVEDYEVGDDTDTAAVDQKWCFANKTELLPFTPGEVLTLVETQPSEQIDETHPHGIIDPRWTVCMVDTSWRMVAFLGEFVDAVDTGQTRVDPPGAPEGTYKVYRAVTRRDSQNTYSGTLGTGEEDDDTILTGSMGDPNNPAKAQLTINGTNYLVMLWADLLAENGTIHTNAIVWGKYDNGMRIFFVSESPCYTPQ